MTVETTVAVKNHGYDTVAIAKRYFGNKAGGAKVDCNQREFDCKWEMIRLMPDPSLDAATLAELKARNVPHPYRWVTVEVVEPYVVEGINKSLVRVNNEVNKGNA
jgi:hypothetical protein